MILYKLTNSFGKTYKETQWGENVTHTASGSGELCGPGWLHAYTSPELAVLLNSIHANFNNPLLWESEGKIEKLDNGLKVGTTKLTTIKKIPLPVYSPIQKAAFNVLCTLEVYNKDPFLNWALKWLSGEDRTYTSELKIREVARVEERILWTSTPEYRQGWRTARAALDSIDDCGKAMSFSWINRTVNAVGAAWAAEVAGFRGKPLDLQILALKALTYS